MPVNKGLGTYYQGEFGQNFEPFIPQSNQGEALPPDAAPTTQPGGVNPYLIPDGLSLMRNLKFLPYRAYPMQIRLLDTYRRQALQGIWQPRWYTVPQDPLVAIAAGDTLNYQLHVAAGSVLWGYSFAVLPATVMGDTASPGDLRIQLVDQCSNAPRIAQPENGNAFVANFKAGAPRAGFNFVMPPEPIVISPGGELLVDIINLVTNDRQCQLLLMFMEPAGSPQ